MSVAAKYIESGRYKKVLLIGADKMSSIIDYKDRTTCIIFGDGAGAALFEPNYEGFGVQDELLRTDGSGRESLKIDAGGSLLPASAETVENNQHVVFQDGKTVFIETDDFKPEKPNSEVGLSTQQIVWREVYNNMMDVLKGFNNEEKDNPTKSYGLLLLDIFKKQRLDFLFPPKLADGKDSVFSPNAKWYKDAEKSTIDKGLKTDFWKVS